VSKTFTAGLSSDFQLLSDKFKKSVDVMPQYMQEGANAVGMEVKTSWISIIGAGGLRPDAKVAKRKWSVGYDVKGKVKPATNIRIKGPLHLWFGDTVPHIIGAGRLGSKGTQYRKSKDSIGKSRRVSGGIAGKQQRIGANKAFGGSNRGVFGKMLAETTKKGSIRAGRRALVIPGADGPKAYAFHPGTKDHMPVWLACKKSAQEIAPAGYNKQVNKALVRAGFGQAQKLKGVFSK
jgi:hypothetical protein